jgi:hypothetical protein
MINPPIAENQITNLKREKIELIKKIDDQNHILEKLESKNVKIIRKLHETDQVNIRSRSLN